MIRGIVKSVTDGAVRFLSAAGRIGESFDRVSFLQHYGFASHPKAGAEVFIDARGNVTFCIASDDRRYRLALQDGEVALYDHLGQKAHLKADGTIEVIGITKATVTCPEVEVVAETKVTLTTPLTECTGNLTVAGGITCTGTYGASGGKIETPGDIKSTGGEVGDSVRNISGDRVIYNDHTHPENGTGGGTTSAPNQGM